MNDRIHIQNLTPGELALMKDLAEVAAQSAVDRTLIALGIDTKNPIQAQAMFGAMREIADALNDKEIDADRQWVRRSRKLSEGAFGKAILSAVALAVLGGVKAIWAGLQTMLHLGP